MAEERQFDLVIVGGGIAGLSCAMYAATLGKFRTLVLEREVVPFAYASGANAAIGRRLTSVAHHTELAILGSQKLGERALLSTQGGCILARDASALEGIVGEASAFGVAHTRHEGSPVPGLVAEASVLVPADGVIDLHGLLTFLTNALRTAGGQIASGHEFLGASRGPRGFQVETSKGSFTTELLVNAAGAWASRVAERAGATRLAVQPRRRHLVYGPGEFPRSAPWLWYADAPLYVRPESNGVLMCPCDERPIEAPALGEQVPTDPSVTEQLASIVSGLAPGLAHVRPQRTWACARSFARDGGFVIGFDPNLAGFFWIAGLGGHGMTTGLEVGRVALDIMLGKREAGPFDPRRLTNRDAELG